MTKYDKSSYKELKCGLDMADEMAKVQAQLHQSYIETEQLKAQLIKSQKLEAVGRLAGGLAHDYGNMLTVIIGHAEIAIGKLSNDHPLSDDLNAILDAAVKSNKLTRQLLTFARKQVSNPEVIELNTVVDNMIKLLRRLIGENIYLYWIPKSGLWDIKMDTSQMDQILANLCVNAKDAIGSRAGRITVKTDNVTVDEVCCSKNVDSILGEFVLLEVIDNGCGMDKSILDNIFEPFFTTKGAGEGTGLGLATVYGIVKQNSGFINVYSEKDRGTTFRIYLPRYLDKKGIIDSENKIEIAQGKGETILLVEDDPDVIEMVRLMLE